MVVVLGARTSHNLYYVKYELRKTAQAASDQSYMIPFPFTDPMISS